MPETKQTEDIRDAVAEAYTRAVAAKPEGTASSCCGSPSTCAPTTQRATESLSDYDPEQLATLPQDAVEHSFGCGDPLAFSQVQPGQTVLDLGSGAGIDLLIAAQRVGPEGRVIGVDMTDAMIEKARANIAEAGATNVEVRKGFIESLPVEDASVDWVISNCVINLSPDKAAVFAEIARVLKPGGHMLVSDIVVDDLPDAIRAHVGLYAACIGGAIPESEYLAAAREAGLADVDVVTRLTYEMEQLRAFVGSAEGAELIKLAENPAAIEPYLEALAGKVHSIRVLAQRSTS